MELWTPSRTRWWPNGPWRSWPGRTRTRQRPWRSSERDLLALDQKYQAEFRNVESLAIQVETEAARLQELFTLADLDVALAIGEAMAADAAYRSALDEVERGEGSRRGADGARGGAARTTTTVDDRSCADLANGSRS